MNPFTAKRGNEVTIDKDVTCCFTGHRTIPRGTEEYLIGRIMDGIKYLYERGTKTFLAGGALGFDTLAAQAVIRSQEMYSDIRLYIIAPCQDQDKFWTRKDKDAYARIKKSADEVIYLSERYYSGCMHDRNRYLVENSSTCICYKVKQDGGTAYTVGYAKEHGLTVFNLARTKC